MPTYSFLSILPFQERIPPAVLLEVLQEVGKQQGFKVSGIPERDKDACFELRFPDEYAKQRLAHFERTVPPARLADPDIQLALQRYTLVFSGHLTSGGVCKISYVTPKKWSNRACAITARELLFPFYDLLKYVLSELEAQEYEAFANDYYLTNCVLDEDSSNALLVSLKKALAKTLDSDCKAIVGPAVQNIIRITGKGPQRTLIPVTRHRRYVRARRRAEAFLEEKWLVKHYLCGLALPLEDLGVKWSDLWLNSWAGSQSESYEEFATFVAENQRAGLEAMNLLLALLGLVLGTLAFIEPDVFWANWYFQVGSGVLLLAIWIHKNWRLAKSARANALKFRRKNPHLFSSSPAAHVPWTRKLVNLLRHQPAVSWILLAFKALPRGFGPGVLRRQRGGEVGSKP